MNVNFRLSMIVSASIVTSLPAPVCGKVVLPPMSGR